MPEEPSDAAAFFVAISLGIKENEQIHYITGRAYFSDLAQKTRF